MKVTVTQLKAPWPEGTKVGSVVELEGDKVPEWAVNKCVPYTGPALAGQAAIDAAVKAAIEQLEATIAEQAALIAKLQGGKGEIVTNPAGADDAGKGGDGKTPKTAAKAQAAAG